MIAYISANIGEIQRAQNQGLIAHLMVVAHYVQKHTMDKLTDSQRYEKLSLTYVGFISLLAEKDYSPGELAAKLGISKQACSKTVKELEELDLLERRTNPEDSRSSLLSLTAKGQQLLQDGNKATTEIQQQFASKIGAERVQQLIVILEKLCSHLEIPIPSYGMRTTSKKSGSGTTRLSSMLPYLSNYFHQTLLASLSDKGFKGLKSSFGQVLGLIRNDGGRIQQIASVIGVSKQAIAVTANELEQLGYISRQSDPEDKRQIILSLSPLGQQLLIESAVSVEALDASIREILSDDEYQKMEGTMAALYFQVADNYNTLAVLPAKIQQLSQYLLEELGIADARTLAQQLLTITRGDS